MPYSLSRTLSLVIVFCALIIMLSTNPRVFEVLALYSDAVNHGQWWRLLTANLVHFGWAHTLMNTAALLLCTLAFFSDCTVKKFSILLIWCCLSVGVGIYFLNPEYTPYAGLSGAIHGLIVAGLLQTRVYPVWIRVIGLSLIAAKLIQENSSDYEATDLQALIPAAVAVEAHVYGAIAGALFAAGDLLFTKSKKRNH